MYLYIFLYGVFVYLSDQIALNYVVCIYFASPGASHLHSRPTVLFSSINLNVLFTLSEELCTAKSKARQLFGSIAPPDRVGSLQKSLNGNAYSRILFFRV